LAWLNTAPIPEKKHSVSVGSIKPMTRLQTMRLDRKDDDYMPDMPEVEGHHQMLNYLWDCGPFMSGGMGEQPLSHSEIWCWQDNSGIELNAWQARTLRRLSAEYLAQCQASSKPDCPSPIEMTQMTDLDRQRVNDKIQGALRMLITTNPNRGRA
jgi:hypothetical protein